MLDFGEEKKLVGGSVVLAARDSGDIIQINRELIQLTLHIIFLILPV